MHGEQRPERCRQRHHDANTSGHAQQSAGEPEAHCLKEKDAQQVCGVRAEGLENGQRVHVLLEMRMHGHGNPDGAKHQRDEADEAQDGSGIIEALRKAGIAFAEVCHLRVRQRRFQLRAYCRSLRVGCQAARRRGRELEQQSAGCAAAGSQ